MLEYSMDNPPLVTWPYLRLGDSFIYKGDYCTVKRMYSNSFEYVNQSREHIRYFMSFAHYMTTPSYFARFHKRFV